MQEVPVAAVPIPPRPPRRGWSAAWTSSAPSGSSRCAPPGTPEAIARCCSSIIILVTARRPARNCATSPASEEGILGAIGFGAAAWKVQSRDAWIGWSQAQRRGRLHLVLNNTRFLLLPWVRCPNLGSKVLALCARRLGADFRARYGYTPVLLETFVERERFTGGVYRAANWQGVGHRQGRGRNRASHAAALPVKAVWLYPLRPDCRAALAGGPAT